MSSETGARAGSTEKKKGEAFVSFETLLKSIYMQMLICAIVHELRSQFPRSFILYGEKEARAKLSTYRS